LEMRGNISGTLAARLTSGLFVRAIKPEIKKSKLLYGNVIAAVVLSLIVGAVLGIIACSINFLFFGEMALRIIYIALTSAFLSSMINIPLTVIAVFWLFERGYDPNNIMGPYVTTVGDIVSILSLLAAIMIF